MAYGAPIVAAVVAAAATVYSTQAQASAARKIERQNDRAAEQAKKIAGQKAEDELQRHKATIATQEGRYAASGLSMEGSPLLVKMESLKESEEQLKRIREGGEYESLTYKELAQNAGSRASQIQTSGYLDAAGQLSKGTYKAGKTYDWW